MTPNSSGVHDLEVSEPIPELRAIFKISLCGVVGIGSMMDMFVIYFTHTRTGLTSGARLIPDYVRCIRNARCVEQLPAKQCTQCSTQVVQLRRSTLVKAD